MRSFKDLFPRRRGELTMEQLDRLRRELPNTGDLEYDHRPAPAGFTEATWQSVVESTSTPSDHGFVASVFPKVSTARGGVEYVSATTEKNSTYYNPEDPTVTGAKMEVGDMWVDPGTGRVQVWNGSAWTEVVDPAGRGGFFGDGRTGFEQETAEERWKREAERADGDCIRLGDHWARKSDDGWACEACGGESADAGLLAETDCG